MSLPPARKASTIRGLDPGAPGPAAGLGVPGPGSAARPTRSGTDPLVPPVLPPREWAGLLSQAEVAWSQRRRGEGERRGFIAGRALLRQVLAQTLGCAPKEVALADEDHRPRLVHPASGLHVSQAHGGSLVACALARRPVGVHIEGPSLEPFDPSVAASTCSPPEQYVLSQLAPEERAQAWRRIWVRKAAVDQAMSPGVRLAPSSLTVGMAGARIRSAGSRSRSWRLASLPLGEGYLGAVACRGRAWRLRVHWVEPAWDPRLEPKLSNPG